MLDSPANLCQSLSMDTTQMYWHKRYGKMYAKADAPWHNGTEWHATFIGQFDIHVNLPLSEVTQYTNQAGDAYTEL